jgi:hypothetical protein
MVLSLGAVFPTVWAMARFGVPAESPDLANSMVELSALLACAVAISVPWAFRPPYAVRAAAARRRSAWPEDYWSWVQNRARSTGNCVSRDGCSRRSASWESGLWSSGLRRPTAATSADGGLGSCCCWPGQPASWR